MVIVASWWHTLLVPFSLGCRLVTSGAKEILKAVVVHLQGVLTQGIGFGRLGPYQQA